LLVVGSNGQGCSLIVPQAALTIAGLATPFLLMAPCNQTNPTQSTFVHGTVIDINTGNMYVYNPVVVNQGTQPGIPAFLPNNPPTNVVIGIWFGTNADSVTLVDDGTGSLTGANCVNGVQGSIFGQFAYCNAPAFFATANRFVASGIIQIPALQTAFDGLPCPTIRDFFVIDMSQSGNVITDYLVANNKIYQDTAVARNSINGSRTTKLTNNGDNRLLSVELAAAMGCPPWTVPDLADPGNVLPALPLNEIQAQALQAMPQALVPLNDPMARVSGQPNLQKVNQYRLGVDQAAAVTNNDADSTAYCTNLYYTAPSRLVLNQNRFSALVSPDPNVATSLYAYMAFRLFNTFGDNGLGCQTILGVPNPVVLQIAATGQALGATITVPVAPAPPSPGTSSKAVVTIVFVVVFCVLAILIGTFLAYRWEQTRDFFKNMRGP